MSLEGGFVIEEDSIIEDFFYQRVAVSSCRGVLWFIRGWFYVRGGLPLEGGFMWEGVLLLEGGFM